MLITGLLFMDVQPAFLYIQAYMPKDHMTQSGLDYSYQSLIKNTPQGVDYSPVRYKKFLIWDSLYTEDIRLC